MERYATLSSKGKYTSFKFGEYTIRFRTSDQLEKYTKILEWDKGYLVVMAQYKNLLEEEEYIDLLPILDNLYIDRNSFLNQISEVRIQYA